MKKILMMMTFLIISNLKSQTVDKNDIKVLFNIYLDNKKVETDSIQIGFMSSNKMDVHATITDSFSTYFKPNGIYNIFISHPNYGKTTFKLNTYNSKNSIIKINLDKSKDTYLGELKFNNKLEKYIINE